MGNERHSTVMRLAILAGVIVTAILVLGTIWMGRSASHDTSEAVRSVSLLFLDELASRREQVVSSSLSNYISDLQTAVELMEKDDLSSVEKLQAYQAKMKQLYVLEKFAFVDENGLIYTSMGTRTDIDRYHFDYTSLSKAEVSLKDVDDNDKKVVIAMPVDRLPFEGEHLVVCFMEIDMDHMLEQFSLQTGNNGTTFCNLYTREGEPLTNIVLGGLANQENLLEAMEQAQFEKGRSFSDMQQDFEQGNGNVVSFSYEDTEEIMYYVPVHGTDWMLTYLIQESVITERIDSVTHGIIARSVLQSCLTALVLVGLFTAMISQTRRNAKLNLERETAEAENRIKQQELEERLSLQNELLEQEKQRAQQDMMINALAADYRSVYYVNLDEDQCICYRSDLTGREAVEAGEHLPYRQAFREYGHSYVDEEYREEFLRFIEPERIREGLEKESVLAFRYLVHRDGMDRYEMLRMAAVEQAEDPGDRVVHAVGVGFTDIDAEMRDSMAKNQALSDAMKAAEEASRAKTVFLSNMSHEIRTPMNAIIGLDSLALNDPDLPESTRDYLEKIGSSAQHLLSLINDILDMSRIESGRMSLRNEEFSFSDLLKQVNTIFSGQCQEKGLTYSCHINGHLDDYYIGDNTKLRQVLINILGNAVKFTPSGSVDLTVERTAQYEGRSTLTFVIRDTGIGMSKEYLPRIFETFSQEDVTAASKYGSSGLGMAITKSIVEMMNGTIGVESEKGVGSTFTVTVTLLDSDRMSQFDEELEVRPQEMTVLVIDDNEVACEHARLVLGNVGIAAEVALSGAEALEMVKLRHARREPYNLIIVDWKMPEMDGVETTRQIRSVIGDESAIIILTAYNWDDVLEEALAAGVDSFIAKPLFSGHLLEEFKTALKKRRQTAPVERPRAELAGRRILLAEDMEINAEIMMEVLQMREMEAEHAENGKIAVEMFASHPVGYYDAVLMDMRMPEMDGLQATEAIRAMDREDAKTTPIIALTANAFDEDVQRSLQAGLNAHLSKPVEPQALFDTLETMIEP